MKFKILTAIAIAAVALFSFTYTHEKPTEKNEKMEDERKMHNYNRYQFVILFLHLTD